MLATWLDHERPQQPLESTSLEMLGIHDVLGYVAKVVLTLFLSLLDLVLYFLDFLLNLEDYWSESMVEFIIFGA